ncbi:porin family protein [Fibrobacter succinogenes]|uniref:porin family protein n=1 Tax=Fibrobacter succinogenes TaxID=833 RepID=UPI0013D8A371|nr:porin family protein [Fibrobacter succinogenes]
MKKLYLIVAAVLLATGLSFAQVHVGGHAAASFSTAWGDETDDVPWGFGFNAGAAAKIGLNDMISVVPEAGIALRRSSDDDQTWSTWAIEIPVLARINVMPQLYLEVGPQIAFLLSSEMEYDYGYATETIKYGDSKIDALNTFEFGLDAGVGYSVMQNLDVNFRFALGLTSILDSKKLGAESDQSVKNMQLQLGATYWFN